MVFKHFLEHNKCVRLSPPGILTFSRTGCPDAKSPRPLKSPSEVFLSQNFTHYAFHPEDCLAFCVLWYPGPISLSCPQPSHTF